MIQRPQGLAGIMLPWSLDAQETPLPRPVPLWSIDTQVLQDLDQDLVSGDRPGPGPGGERIEGRTDQRFCAAHVIERRGDLARSLWIRHRERS